MKIEQANSYRAVIMNLLSAEKLPITDLPRSLENFSIAIENGELIGVAGLEVYGGYGLLRSVVVGHRHRNKGIASKLVQRIETVAAIKGIAELYLLTETAANYFELKNYKIIVRQEVPAEIQASSEFRHVCPTSAIVMKKFLSQLQ